MGFLGKACVCGQGTDRDKRTKRGRWQVTKKRGQKIDGTGESMGIWRMGMQKLGKKGEKKRMCR